MPENEAANPTAQAHQDVAKSTEAKAESSAAAKASDELSEDDLETVSGGVKKMGAVQTSNL